MAIRSSKSKSTGIFPVFRDSYVICAFQKNLSGAFPPVKSASIPPLLRPTIAAGGGAAGYGSDPARNHRADSHTPPPIFTPPPPPYRSPNPTSNGGAGTRTPPPPPPQFSSSSGKDRLLEEVTRKVRHASRAGVAKIMSLFFFLFSLTAVRSLALVSRCLLRLNVESILHSVVIEGTNSDSYSLPFPVILMIILLASLRIWRSGAVSLA